MNLNKIIETLSLKVISLSLDYVDLNLDECHPVPQRLVFNALAQRKHVFGTILFHIYSYTDLCSEFNNGSSAKKCSST